MHVAALIQQLRAFAEAEGAQESSAQQIADEMVALQSIFGEQSVALLPVRQRAGSPLQTPPATDGPLDGSKSQAEEDTRWSPDSAIRLCITVPLDRDGEADAEETAASIKLSATVPPGYPQRPTAPQLQLLNRYIGPHGVDHTLFGQVLRIYHQDSSIAGHAIFQPGEVALFDGIERVRDKVEEWYSAREAEALQRREDDRLHRPGGAAEETEVDAAVRETNSTLDASNGDGGRASPSSGVTLISAPAITERKSVFVGHAAVLTEASQVPLVLSELLRDRRVARATHPAIHAWVCRAQEGGAVLRDCQDDGETAAGGRLAHLLDVLHLENVIVVVTRWYGGVQLGPDRFKLINRAARDALEVAQLVAGPLNPGLPGAKASQRRVTQATRYGRIAECTLPIAYDARVASDPLGAARPGGGEWGRGEKARLWPTVYRPPGPLSTTTMKFLSFALVVVLALATCHSTSATAGPVEARALGRRQVNSEDTTHKTGTTPGKPVGPTPSYDEQLLLPNDKKAWNLENDADRCSGGGGENKDWQKKRVGQGLDDNVLIMQRSSQDEEVASMYGIDASGDLEPFGVVGLRFTQVWEKKEHISGSYYTSIKELGKDWVGLTGDYDVWENKTMAHVSDIHNGGTKIEITYSVDAKGKGKSTISSTKPFKCTSSNQDGGTVWTCETH